MSMYTTQNGTNMSIVSQVHDKSTLSLLAVAHCGTLHSLMITHSTWLEITLQEGIVW